MTTRNDGGNLAASGDRELRALFAARRPDAARFRAGVAARLARSAGGSGGSAPPAGPERAWRERAASWLPALPPETSLGPKWSTWLSVPALLLVGCFAAFWRGDRSLVAALHRAHATPAGRQSWRVAGRFWQRHANWLRAAFAGAVLGGLGFVIGAGAIRDVILVALIGSMAVLVGKVGALAAREGAPTEAIARCVIDLLLATMIGLICWYVTGGTALGETTEADAITVLLLGILAVLTLRGWRARRPGLGISCGITLLLLGIPVAMGWIIRAWPEPAAAALRRELAEATPSGGDQARWRALELSGDALRAAGEPLPELSHLRQHLAGLIADHPGTWPDAWTAGARLGLIDAEQWQHLSVTEYVGHHLPRLLVQDGRLLLFGPDRFVLPALLTTRDLSASERAHLVARIEQTWPGPEARTGLELESSLLCVQWLDLLDRGDLVAAHVPALRDLLRRHWVPQRAASVGTTGGFSDVPGGQRAWLPWTIYGLELLVRIGPPPEIALPQLRTFLQRNGGRYPMAWQTDGWRKLAYAGNSLLDARFGVPSGGWWVLDQRLPIGCLLLVLLALRAVWFTRPLGRPGHGAMP